MTSQSNQAPVIAIDAMGGDAGTETIVAAVALALAQSEQVQLILVGDAARIKSALQAQGLAEHPRVRVKHTSEVILSDDSPASVLRSKKDSSMRE